MKRAPLILGLVVTIVLRTPAALALTLPTASIEAACRSRVIGAIVAVHDEYRSAVYGTVRAADGAFIARTGGKVSGYEAGMFPTKRRLTSELVEPIVESYRTLRCQMLTVCAAMQDSFQKRTGEAAVLGIGGCERKKLSALRECAVAGKLSQQSQPGLISFCTKLVDDTLKAERASLKLAVAYDAWYRYLLQSSGYIASMLEHFPNQLLGPVRSMVRMLGRFHQIPCFLAQCDMPNP